MPVFLAKNYHRELIQEKAALLTDMLLPCTAGLHHTSVQEQAYRKPWLRAIHNPSCIWPLEDDSLQEGMQTLVSNTKKVEMLSTTEKCLHMEMDAVTQVICDVVPSSNPDSQQSSLDDFILDTLMKQVEESQPTHSKEKFLKEDISQHCDSGINQLEDVLSGTASDADKAKPDIYGLVSRARAVRKLDIWDQFLKCEPLKEIDVFGSDILSKHTLSDQENNTIVSETTISVVHEVHVKECLTQDQELEDVLTLSEFKETKPACTPGICELKSKLKPIDSHNKENQITDIEDLTAKISYSNLSSYEQSSQPSSNSKVFPEESSQEVEDLTIESPFSGLGSRDEDCPYKHILHSLHSDTLTLTPETPFESVEKSHLLKHLIKEEQIPNDIQAMRFPEPRPSPCLHEGSSSLTDLTPPSLSQRLSTASEDLSLCWDPFAATSKEPGLERTTYNAEPFHGENEEMCFRKLEHKEWCIHNETNIKENFQDTHSNEISHPKQDPYPKQGPYSSSKELHTQNALTLCSAPDKINDFDAARYNQFAHSNNQREPADVRNREFIPRFFQQGNSALPVATVSPVQLNTQANQKALGTQDNDAPNITVGSAKHTPVLKCRNKAVSGSVHAEPSNVVNMSDLSDIESKRPNKENEGSSSNKIIIDESVDVRSTRFLPRAKKNHPVDDMESFLSLRQVRTTRSKKMVDIYPVMSKITECTDLLGYKSEIMETTSASNASSDLQAMKDFQQLTIIASSTLVSDSQLLYLMQARYNISVVERDMEEDIIINEDTVILLQCAASLADDTAVEELLKFLAQLSHKYKQCWVLYHLEIHPRKPCKPWNGKTMDSLAKLLATSKQGIGMDMKVLYSSSKVSTAEFIRKVGDMSSSKCWLLDTNQNRPWMQPEETKYEEFLVCCPSINSYSAQVIQHTLPWKSLLLATDGELTEKLSFLSQTVIQELYQFLHKEVGLSLLGDREKNIPPSQDMVNLTDARIREEPNLQNKDTQASFQSDTTWQTGQQNEPDMYQMADEIKSNNTVHCLEKSHYDLPATESFTADVPHDLNTYKVEQDYHHVSSSPGETLKCFCELDGDERSVKTFNYQSLYEREESSSARKPLQLPVRELHADRKKLDHLGNLALRCTEGNFSPNLFPDPGQGGHVRSTKHCVSSTSEDPNRKRMMTIGTLQKGPMWPKASLSTTATRHSVDEDHVEVGDKTNRNQQTDSLLRPEIFPGRFQKEDFHDQKKLWTEFHETSAYKMGSLSNWTKPSEESSGNEDFLKMNDQEVQTVAYLFSKKNTAAAEIHDKLERNKSVRRSPASYKQPLELFDNSYNGIDRQRPYRIQKPLMPHTDHPGIPRNYQISYPAHRVHVGLAKPLTRVQALGSEVKYHIKQDQRMPAPEPKCENRKPLACQENRVVFFSPLLGAQHSLGQTPAKHRRLTYKKVPGTKGGQTRLNFI